VHFLRDTSTVLQHFRILLLPYCVF